MLFNTLQFFIFFLIVWAVCLVLRGTPRKIFLLIASYYFYMCWNSKYILVIIAITLIDYVAGLLIEKSSRALHRNLFLALSLFCNIGLLVVFKYFNFLSLSTAQLLSTVHVGFRAPILQAILPVGLSFHTFQAMSYTIDVHKGKSPAERNLLNYALYVAFFPQMVAGPIERPNQLLPQFRHSPEFSLERVSSGLQRALWGLFKKMVIADTLAGFVNQIYAAPRNFTGAELLVATVAFALQIYCDFSGYSDIALGVARITGYELRLNFAQPYFSRSIAEFWHRWHISLSTWFRDYVYIPLGGNRVGISRFYFNLLITFMVSGLWHGANWTFVVWGALHGFFLITSRATAGPRDCLRKLSRLDRFPNVLAALQWLLTMSLVCLAWVVFRAKNIGDAAYIVTHFFPLGRFESLTLTTAGIARANMPFIAFSVVVMFVVEWWMMHPHRAPRFWFYPPLRWCLFQIGAYCIVFFGVFGHVDFIYFQF